MIDRILSAKEREAILSFRDKFFNLEIDEEKAIEVQNIATGVFSPLKGFMNQEDYREVVQNSRLASGHAWTLPIVLPVDRETAKKFAKNDTIILKTKDAVIASMQVEDIYCLGFRGIRQERLRHHRRKTPRRPAAEGQRRIVHRRQHQLPERPHHPLSPITT